MRSEFSDLIPMFLAEASGRLERLHQLIPKLEGDPESRREAQRELHTLKGAGRMLKLTTFAQLCHELEELVQRGDEGLVVALQRGLDQLEEALTELANPKVNVSPSAPPPSPGSSDHLRLASKDLDLLADRATRLRILARGAEVFHRKLREYAALAQQGVFEAEPHQVLAVLSTALRKLALELEAGQKRLQRLADTHLEHAVSLQLQPLGPFLHTLARHARELAQELGKELRVTVRGEDVKLDRRIARELEEALIHVVRNAVDHGLEPAQERQARGKDPTGGLTLEAKVEGARVQLTVADDGGGIDAAKVLEKAVSRGLIPATEADRMSPEEALRLLFTPGFSTQEQATHISGRGVGLDAVAAACSRVGGEVSLTSIPGEGTRVVLSLPATRRGEEVLVVQVGKFKLLYPKAAVRRYRRLGPNDVVERGGRFLFRENQKLLPFVFLGRFFQGGQTPGGLLLSGEVGGSEVTVCVDAVLGEEEVVIRELANNTLLPGQFAGAAVLASGEAVPLLAPQALIHLQRVGSTVSKPKPATPEPLRVLLVDDSLVTREMERRLLADAGFSVAVAADAEEALTTLGERPVDCLITDIEMPGMSGLELTRCLRSLPQFAHLPVIVVSTRNRPEDRLAGLAAGADAYLAKQGLDASELVGLVRRLGGRG